MINYREKSDFEIIKAVAVDLGYKVRPCEESVLAYSDIGYKTVDPCDTPADEMRIIIEKKISLWGGDADDIWVADTTRSLEPCLNEHPLRAALEVLLEMNKWLTWVYLTVLVQVV